MATQAKTDCSLGLLIKETDKKASNFHEIIDDNPWILKAFWGCLSIVAHY